MSDKRFGCLGIGLVVLLCISIGVNLVLFGITANRRMGSVRHRAGELPEFDEEMVAEGSDPHGGKIVQISLNGLISSSISGSVGDTMVDDMRLALRQASEDDRIKAIVLCIDSPGGEVTASNIIYEEVKRARAKKPVVVSMGSVAASGGYYISCGGSYLIANETTITGSIGVIIETFNYEQLLGKIGLESVVFKSGQFKDMLSGARKMTPEEQAYTQALVMQTYDTFVRVVSTERNIPAEQLKSGIADGRIISGKDAVGDKLVNQIGLIDDAYDKARELGHAPGAAVVKYEPKFHLGKLLHLLGKTSAPKIEISLSAAGIVPQLQAGRFYFLPPFYAL